MKKTENTPNGTDDISRKEAIKKMGKYAALTAMGTFMILNPKKAQAHLHLRTLVVIKQLRE